jgi:hypothetical protein
VYVNSTGCARPAAHDVRGLREKRDISAVRADICRNTTVTVSLSSGADNDDPFGMTLNLVINEYVTSTVAVPRYEIDSCRIEGDQSSVCTEGGTNTASAHGLQGPLMQRSPVERPWWKRPEAP